jgi:hypothetical protein
MKIQLDTVNKTIQIEEDVNLHDFYEQINGLLPSGLWRDFTLKVGKIVKWEEPYKVTPNTPFNPYRPLTNPNPYQSPPFDPNQGQQIWYTTSTDNSGGGLYNIDVTY